MPHLPWARELTSWPRRLDHPKCCCSGPVAKSAYACTLLSDWRKKVFARVSSACLVGVCSSFKARNIETQSCHPTSKREYVLSRQARSDGTAMQVRLAKYSECE